MTAVWTALSGVAALAALYWLLLALQLAANLAVYRRLPPRSRTAGEVVALPPVVVIIPARDEERALGATLDAALGQDYPGELHVVVVDDRSTDRTPEVIARRAGDPRLAAVAGSDPPPGWLGKPHALHLGVEHALDRLGGTADGAFYLFIDADVALAPDAVADGVAHALREGLDHLALLPYFVRRGFWEEILIPALASTFYLFFPSFLARLSRPRDLAFGSGSYNLVRRRAYERIGGHAAFPGSVVDDIRLAQEVKLSGGRTTLALGDRQATIRMYHGFREMVDGFTKNTHAIFTRHGWSGIAYFVAGTLFQAVPFSWPVVWLVDPQAATGTAPGQLLLAALVLAVLSRGVLQARLGYPLWPAALHPLMALTCLGIALRSVATARGLFGKAGVVRWRGREYRTEETEF